MKTESKNAKKDLELVLAIKNENALISDRAFNTLYKKYHNVIFFQFKKTLKNEEDIQDIILEAFLKVKLNIEKYNENMGGVSTWLFKLTQNVFIDKLRKKKANLILLTDLEKNADDSHIIEYEISDSTYSPEIQFTNSERDKIINNIIDNWNNSQMVELIKLRFFEEMSYQDIADFLDIPIGTVKANLYRAKNTLKEKFIENNISL
jgi:RNA polymerase sigma factor (sigma-70 family)